MFHRTVSKLMLIDVPRDESPRGYTEINDYLRHLVDARTPHPATT